MSQCLWLILVLTNPDDTVCNQNNSHWHPRREKLFGDKRSRLKSRYLKESSFIVLISLLSLYISTIVHVHRSKFSSIFQDGWMKPFYKAIKLSVAIRFLTHFCKYSMLLGLAIWLHSIKYDVNAHCIAMRKWYKHVTLYSTYNKSRRYWYMK